MIYRWAADLVIGGSLGAPRRQKEHPTEAAKTLLRHPAMGPPSGIC